MYGTVGGDIARQRMNDRLRDAEIYRLTRSTRRARAAQRQSALRRMGGSALSILLWPVRH